MAEEERNLHQRRANQDGSDLSNGTSHGGSQQPTNMTNPWGNPAMFDNHWTPPGSAEIPQYQTASEYTQAVQQWLHQYQWWNSMNWFYMTFPFYAMSCMSMQQQTSLQREAFGPGTPAAAFETRSPIPATGARPPSVTAGHEYRIPSLWKRVVAEFIDFFLLFLIKLFVTILTVEYVGIIDLQKYDLDVLLSQNLDYNTAFATMSELIVMEVINRIFICIFETLCLRKGVGGIVGGTTPGKRIMGLTVVLCEEIMDLPGSKVRVVPAQDIGFWNALVRSVIKNFSLAFFFPVCFTVYFFQHNRAAYDIISSCVVVERTEEDLLLDR